MPAMRNRINWSAVTLLVVCAAMIGYQTRANRAVAPIESTVVVSLNLESLFQGLSQRERADAELTQLAEALDAEGQSRRDEIELLNQDRGLYPPGSKQFEEATSQLAEKTYQLQAYLEFAVRKLDAAKARNLRRIYSNIKASVGEIAEINGYDVVLVDDSVVSLPEDANEAETMRQISARRMLHGNPAVDITDEVTQYMNDRFRISQGP